MTDDLVEAVCWHCGDVVLVERVRCERCPSECDDADCEASGCRAPATEEPAPKQGEAGDTEAALLQLERDIREAPDPLLEGECNHILEALNQAYNLGCNAPAGVPVSDFGSASPLSRRDEAGDTWHLVWRHEDGYRIRTATEEPAPKQEENAAMALAWLRSEGWAVAVHNDYRLNGEPHTFWLFTKGERALKGEGRTDAEALAQALARCKAPARAPLERTKRLAELGALLSEAPGKQGEIIRQIWSSFIECEPCIAFPTAGHEDGEWYLSWGTPGRTLDIAVDSDGQRSWVFCDHRRNISFDSGISEEDGYLAFAGLFVAETAKWALGSAPTNTLKDTPEP